MLECDSVAAAARKARIGYATLKRWLRDDAEFRAAYRKARHDLFDESVRVLQRAATDTSKRLVALTKSAVPQVALGAIKLLREEARAGQEVIDLGDRIDALERAKEEG